MDRNHEATKASFFACIAANRHDDVSRLVFADWCDENEEYELAEMLRGGSRKWLEGFIDKYYSHRYIRFGYKPITVEELVTEASCSNGYFISVGTDLHSAGELDAGEEDLFWKHIRVMTGIECSEKHRSDFVWSCTC